MHLENLQFVKLLPEFMRSDDANKAFSALWDWFIPKLTYKAQLATTWDKIDLLEESELDEMAWELNITWYDSGASIETKRDLIKNSDLVRSRFGTPWAVESLMKSYFGDGTEEDWFEYGGQPGYFRLRSTNIYLTNELYEPFLRMLRIVKRNSAWLEGIIIDQSADAAITYGAVGTPYERINDKANMTPRYKVAAYYGVSLSPYERISGAADLTPRYRAAAYTAAAAYHYEQVGFAITL